MKKSLAIVVAAAGLAVLAFAPTEASAGGRDYGYAYNYGCCCPTYCCGWVRGRGFNRPYAHARYGYYGYRYPLARDYARREVLRRRW